MSKRKRARWEKLRKKESWRKYFECGKRDHSKLVILFPSAVVAQTLICFAYFLKLQLEIKIEKENAHDSQQAE